MLQYDTKTLRELITSVKSNKPYKFSYGTPIHSALNGCIFVLHEHGLLEEAIAAEPKLLEFLTSYTADVMHYGQIKKDNVVRAEKQKTAQLKLDEQRFEIAKKLTKEELAAFKLLKYAGDDHDT